MDHGLKMLLALIVVFTVGLLDGLALGDANLNAAGRGLLLSANIIMVGLTMPLIHESSGARLIGSFTALGGVCLWAWTLVQST